MSKSEIIIMRVTSTEKRVFKRIAEIYNLTLSDLILNSAKAYIENNGYKFKIMEDNINE